MEAEVYQIQHSELVDRCKQGDESAFNQLYYNYCRQMYSIALRILQDSTLSEDILQEAFSSAFEKINSFSSEVSFGAWIKRIVINKALNEIKKKKLIFVDVGDEVNQIEQESTNQSAYPALSVNQIQEGVTKLPEGYRVVLTLFLFEKLSHKEISEQLNITESTSKSQYNRAKKKLRQILEGSD